MGWYDAVKDAISVAKKAGDIGLYEKLLDLQQAMRDMQQENNELREQLKSLQDSINLENEMEPDYDNKMFFRKHNNEKIGPYCPVCWQRDKKLCLLQHGGYHDIDLVCPVCSYQIDLGGRKQQSKNMADTISRLPPHPGFKL
ncbi:MAG: hypothetical protein ACFWTN_07585 [Clostridium sp.]